jgi:glycosyltransferase involved in cell wall biosynthesis
MNSPWHIAIVIPARDEQELLPRCLRSVQNARRMLPSHVTSDLIVVADQSTDDTFKLARDFIQGSGSVVETEVGCVGGARALGGIGAGWPTRTLTARYLRRGYRINWPSQTRDLPP